VVRHVAPNAIGSARTMGSARSVSLTANRHASPHREDRDRDIMIQRLYRFRPIDKVLNKKYDELRNQEIYFAHPAELNDPMEGFRDVFWKGDIIVWNNLFKHYLICLNLAFVLLFTCKEEQPFDWRQIPILWSDDPNRTPEQKDIHDEIFRNFFGDESVRSYIEAIAHREAPIRRNQLTAYLRDLHLSGISAIYDCYERRNLVPAQMIAPGVRETLKQGLTKALTVGELLKKIEVNHPDGEVALDKFFTGRRKMTEELDFITLYNGLVDRSNRNRIFVFYGFVDGYAEQIEQQLIYPDWYTACFMAECENSSVWANYGDKHTGVCLIFKIRNNNGRPSLRLRHHVGFSGRDPVFSNIDDAFHKIRYSKGNVPVDFFRSLRMPMPILSRFWYSDDNGKRSPCGDHLFGNTDEVWRTGYWNTFLHGITGKLKDWRYEKEYRLILRDGEVVEFSDKQARKLKYDFNDLEGIIFGIKTGRDEKFEICKIIEEKCRARGRGDFKFYQAYYSSRDQKIEHSELSFIKFR
jgi:hypothetical protein